jgi:hypothetical protein
MSRTACVYLCLKLGSIVYMCVIVRRCRVMRFFAFRSRLFITKACIVRTRDSVGRRKVVPLSAVAALLNNVNNRVAHVKCVVDNRHVIDVKEKHRLSRSTVERVVEHEVVVMARGSVLRGVVCEALCPYWCCAAV